MERDEENGNNNEDTRVVVKAETLDGIASVLGTEIPDSGRNPDGLDQLPDELSRVVETLADVYRGLEAATENDARGLSRKKVREYADREDVDPNAFGHHLRVLEFHGLAVQDGNRWRTADGE